MVVMVQTRFKRLSNIVEDSYMNNACHTHQDGYVSQTPSVSQNHGASWIAGAS